MALSPWTDKTVLITAGPTREHLDPIRYLTNDSSGKMGLALARQARRKGAKVVVILGPCREIPPKGARVVSVVTAWEMYRAVMNWRSRADVVIAAAAVGDWRFAAPKKHKIKKTGTIKLTLIPNPDIIGEIGRRRGSKSRPVLAGFALETRNGVAYARGKMKKKNLDLIVANAPAVLGADRARLTILSRLERKPRVLPEMGKMGAARAILDGIERFL